jgi:hypothetical protein
MTNKEKFVKLMRMYEIWKMWRLMRLLYRMEAQVAVREAKKYHGENWHTKTLVGEDLALVSRAELVQQFTKHSFEKSFRVSMKKSLKFDNRFEQYGKKQVKAHQLIRTALEKGFIKPYETYPQMIYLTGDGLRFRTLSYLAKHIYEELGATYAWIGDLLIAFGIGNIPFLAIYHWFSSTVKSIL